MMTHHIVYISRTSTDLTAGDIEEIVETSKRNNKRQNITGLLLHFRGMFVQVLEGEKKVLDDLLERILLDKRHEEATIIYTRPIHQRLFEDWSMAFHETELMDVLRTSGFHDIDDALEFVVSRQGKELDIDAMTEIAPFVRSAIVKFADKVTQTSA